MAPFTPLLQVRKTFRVKWYRSPIERETLSALMQRSNLRGAFGAVGHLGLWVATEALTFYLFWAEQWIGFADALEASIGDLAPKALA